MFISLKLLSLSCLSSGSILPMKKTSTEALQSTPFESMGMGSSYVSQMLICPHVADISLSYRTGYNNTWGSDFLKSDQWLNITWL